MAEWSSSSEIVKDLDRLSELTCGRKVTTRSPILTSVARGKKVPAMDQDMDFVGAYEDPWNRAVDNPLSFGRGMGINRNFKMDYTTTRDEDDLQYQLRMACGPGYSNGLIEEAFRQDYTEPEDDSDQFEDAYNSDLEDSTKPEEGDQSVQLISSPAKNGPSTPPTKSPVAVSTPDKGPSPAREVTNNSPAILCRASPPVSSPTKIPSPVASAPVKRKPRKFANAVMDSLLRNQEDPSSEPSILRTTNLNPDAPPFEISPPRVEVSVPCESQRQQNVELTSETFERVLPARRVSHYTYPQIYPSGYRPYDLVSFESHKPSFYTPPDYADNFQDFQLNNEEFPPLP